MAKRNKAAATGRSAKRATVAKAGGARKTSAATKKSSARKGSRKAAAGSKTARRKTAARAAASRTSKPVARKKTRAGTPTSLLASAASKVRGRVAGAVAAVVGSFPWATDENDPIVLLEADHRRFEDLLKQGEDTTERAVTGRTRLLDTLTAALNVHELIEEQVLYPALKPHAEARDVVLEGFQEHHVADLIVKELHDLAKDDERWGAKFKVLKESIEHHIQEEEREMFPAARQVLSPEELRALGARMRILKTKAERGR